MVKRFELSVALLLAMICPAALSETPEITAVVPAQGFVDESTDVAIHGERFAPRVWVALLGAARNVMEIGHDFDRPVQDVTVRGGVVSLAQDRGVGIVDARDPDDPRSRAYIRTPGPARAVASSDGLIFAVGEKKRSQGPTRSRGWLTAIDVSDLDNIVSLDTNGTRDEAWDVCIVGHHAYVIGEEEVWATGESRGWLEVVDVSNPRKMESVGSVLLPVERSVGVDVAGGYAFVASAADGVHVVDVSDPGAPMVVGFVDTPGEARDLSVAGDYAYVADGKSGLQVIDVRDPSAPALVAQVAVSNEANGIGLTGRQALVVDSPRGIQIVDVEEPEVPVWIERVAAGGSPWSVAVEGQLAYVAGYDGVLSVIDLSTPGPSGPQRVVETEGEIRSLTRDGDRAYVLTTGRLDVMDVSVPGAPVTVGHVETDPEVHKVAAAGDVAVLATPDAIEIVDIRQPRSPTIASRVEGLGWVQGVAVAGHFAYVTGRFSPLRVIDVSDPYAPQMRGSVFTGALPYAVTVHGNHAYVTGITWSWVYDSWLYVVDVSDPAAPEAQGMTFLSDPAGTPKAVEVDGTLAYVAEGHAGLRLVDVSRPADPRRLERLNTPGHSFDLAVSAEQGVLIADGTGGLLVADGLRLAARYDTQGYSVHGVEVHGDYAYVADQTSGLKVVKLNPRLENVSASTPERIDATVPPGVAPGGYDVYVKQESEWGEGVLESAFLACPRRALTAALDPLTAWSPPRVNVGPVAWRLTVGGDASFFAQEDRLEARLCLPEVPEELTISTQAGDGSGRMAIELLLAPGLGLGYVALVGDSPDEVEDLWQSALERGGFRVPRRTLQTFGDVVLGLVRRPPQGHGAAPVRYRFEFSPEGTLVSARGEGPGVDLELEAIGKDEMGCVTQSYASLAEATVTACEAFAVEHPELMVDCTF